MADYQFITRWQFEAPILRVWDAIADPHSYPKWWPHFTEVTLVREGDPAGIGSVYRVHTTTKLLYSLTFETETIRREPPRRLELRSMGQLEGTGLWELAEEGGATTAVYHWHVRTTKRWMNLTAPLLRPVFKWSHNMLMDEGGEGLAKYLRVRLLANESGQETGHREVHRR